jgi:uncharacterized membrane protein
MAQTLTALSYTLHTLATAIFIGYFLLASLVAIPALRQAGLNSRALGEISRRSRFWIYAALAVFLLTGLYLMLVDPNYRGVGQFNNAWSVLMLVKHIAILGMLALGFFYNAILRVGHLLRSKPEDDAALARFTQYHNLMSGLGVLVVLLTAVSQIE